MLFWKTKTGWNKCKCVCPLHSFWVPSINFKPKKCCSFYEKACMSTHVSLVRVNLWSPVGHHIPCLSFIFSKSSFYHSHQLRPCSCMINLIFSSFYSVCCCILSFIRLLPLQIRKELRRRRKGVKFPEYLLWRHSFI